MDTEPIEFESSDPSRPFANLLPILDALVVGGNSVLQAGFGLSQAGWTCRLRSPIDFELISRRFSLPPTVQASPDYDSILDRQSWCSIEGPGARAANSRPAPPESQGAGVPVGDYPVMPEIQWIGRDPRVPIELEPYVAPSSSVAFVSALVSAVPGLVPLLAEHLQDQDGELLPHVFMGAVTRWFMAHYLVGDPQPARALADWLDDQYPTSGDYVQNVIDVSFLENLPWPPDAYTEAAQLLGPNLSRSLQEMQNWRPGP